MRCVVTSDTHGRHAWTAADISACDVFIHAGDLSAGGSYEETLLEMGYLRGLAGDAHILVVPGNHDQALQHDLMSIELALAKYAQCGKIDILIDRAIEIGGHTFYGSPWTPPFNEWFFMATEDELQEKYKAMPQQLDMLITHGPPRGILDPGFKQAHAGSEALLQAVWQRVINHHVFGHLHGAGGQSEMWVNGCTYHNVAAVDEAYNIKNKPKVIDL